MNATNPAIGISRLKETSPRARLAVIAGYFPPRVGDDDRRVYKRRTRFSARNKIAFRKSLIPRISRQVLYCLALNIRSLYFGRFAHRKTEHMITWGT